MTVVTRSPGAVGAGQWTNFTPASLAVADGVAAEAYLDSSVIGAEGFVQSASAFGFAIPADATITSVTVEGRYKTSDVGYISLTPSQGVAAWEQDEYGVPDWTVIQGVTDAGTAGLPSVAQLNSPGFAVTAHATRPMGYVSWVYLDYITLTVEYDEYVPPPPPEPDVPTVVTTAVSSITPNWASSGGTVTAENGSAVSERGICWGAGGVTKDNADGVVNSGGGLGGYVSVASPLAEERGYNVRAYATNASGTGYGAELYFETPRGIPTVETHAVSAITGYWASSGGTVTSEGWAAVSQRGVCWSAYHPTLADPSTSNGGGIGGYASAPNNLTPSRGYHVRAYAVNSYGIAYGVEIYFETLFAPTVVTTAITAITPFTATGGGTVTSEGSAAVSDRGIFWGTSPNPRTVPGAGGSGGIGAFTNYLTGLAPGTRYFVAAWATNNIGLPTTTYGADVTFVTHALPAVATAGAYDIEATTATGGGNVVSDGGEAVTARGVCWSVAENPTTANSHTTDGSGLGAFVSALTGLTGGVTYNVRAYATNLAGIAYGAAVVFTATASAPPVEPPPGPPRDPSQNLLFDGTLELMVGTLDVAGSATQMKYSNSNPGGFGNLSFRLPADAPYAAFDAQVVKGAAVTMKHGLTGFVVTLFEGEVTSDVSHATIVGGKAYYDVTCAGIWWKAGQRKDFSMVTGDDAYDQWFTMDDNAKAFQVSTDGKLEIRLAAGQSAAAGDSASLYYWLGKGLGDPAASIDFLFGLLGLNVSGAETDWQARVSSAPTPWGPWTECIYWWGGSTDGLAICIPTLGDNPQALRLELSTASAVDALDVDRFVSLDKMSVGSGVSANGLSAVGAANPTVVTSTSAHGLRSGDRVFIMQTAASTPTISGWRTVTVTNATHFTVPVAVTTAGGAGTFYKATRIDQALVEIAVTTGLATLASLQPGGIGNLNWGLVVRPHASRAGGIDLLAATNVAPFDYGFWENKTFYCQDRPEIIRALLPARTNYCTSPSFELDTNSDGLCDGWTTNMGGLFSDTNITGTPVFTRVAGIVGTGAYAQRIQYTGVAGDAAGKTLVLFSPETAVGSFVPTENCTISTHIKGALAGCTLNLAGAGATAAGGWNTNFAPTAVTPTPSVVRVSVARTSLPASNSRVYLKVVFENIHEGDTIDITIDDVLIEKSASLGDYFDGSYPDCAWTGTANASTSTRAASTLITLPAARALHDYLIDSSLPGIDFDVRRATEDSPTTVKVLYKFRAEDGATGSYPDGTALAVYRDIDPATGLGRTYAGDWSDASVVLDVWNEWADLSLTTAQAGDLGDQILAWLSANAYQGGGSIAPATLPLRAEGTKPVAYIRAGDYIEDSNLATGPLMITGFSMDADRGIATLGIGENRRAFVERLTPDKA